MKRYSLRWCLFLAILLSLILTYQNPTSSHVTTGGSLTSGNTNQLPVDPRVALANVHNVSRAPRRSDLARGLPRASLPVAEVPVTILNGQSVPTSQPYQDSLVIDSARWSSYINPDWSNVEFTYSNGTPIPAWIETNATNTAASTLVWLRLDGIPAYGALTVYMQFFPSTESLLSVSGPIGEAPSLSPTYGGSDDGNLVFNFYDNFAGNALSSSWTLGSGAAGYVSVNNGLTAAPDVLTSKVDS